MEFYRAGATTPIPSSSFQFPTGWNSTRFIFANEIPIAVSIPNGMEFYDGAITTHVVEERFNSQRDGILRRRDNHARRRGAFQFPTGWNSTLLLGYALLIYEVSIPNGMEFYLVG